MNIKAASTDDYESISQLFWESDNYHFQNQPNIYNETKEHFRQFEYIKKLIEDPKSLFYTLEINNKIVGFIYGYEELKGFLPFHKKRKYFYIENIIIGKRYQQKGYGKLLLQKIINDCKEKKYSDIVLNVYTFNKKAISLYNSFGFQELSKDMILEL